MEKHVRHQVGLDWCHGKVERWIVALNIKKPRVHALARQAAERTGLSQTSAIEEALERLLASLDARGNADKKMTDLTRIVGDIDARLTDSDRAALLTTDLYDDTGLPA